jgi:hypothetical protein
MGPQLGVAEARTVSHLASARTAIAAPVDERGVDENLLESEIRLAAYTDVPVLVTADTLAAANRVACAIQERLKSQQILSSVVTSSVTATQLVELLKSHTGSAVLEDVGSFDDRAQAVLSEFLEGRVNSRSGDSWHVRILATGLTDLYSRVMTRKFRDVLFYRLNTIHISLSRQTTIESY